MRTLGDIKPGQTIGRYEFLVPIAEGGMASVWAARLKGTRGFQKTLAVKMMLASLSDNPQFEQMFLDEARIASRIHHPNVVEIFDLGDEQEVLYIVMEYVDGEPLSTIFRTANKKNGMPVGIAVRIIADAAAGLHAAHELKDDNDQTVGLVHRDVSPQNVLVTYDGNVKVVDFGVAKAAGRESEATSAGTVKGKAPYMSPEQALGKEIDRRTDIFALGIMLFQLTTGKHPFRGESDIITLHNIIERPAPLPSTIIPSYPRPLEAVVLKALEKSPGKRFQTGAELEAALDRVMPPTAPRVRPADVGRFVRDTVGDRGEKRRDALRGAVRLADERLQNELDAAKLAARPVHDIGLTGTVGSISVSGVRSDLIPTAIDTPRPSFPGSGPPSIPSALTPASGMLGRPSLPPTSASQPSITSVASPGVASTNPPPSGGEYVAPRSSKKGPLVAVAIAAIAVLSGVGFVATRGKAKASPPSLAAQPPAATTTMPVVPPAATSVAAPTPSASEAPATVDSLPAVAKPDVPAATGRVAVSGGGGRAPDKPEKPEKPEKPADKPDKPKKPGGFVPPPLNDPGF